VKTMWHFSH